MFEKIFKRSSWTDIVISLVFILLGVLLVAKPTQTVGAISIILGVLFIAMGALKLIEYYTSKTKEDWLLTVALVSVIFGIIVLFASDSILAFFRVILGIWIIVTGISMETSKITILDCIITTNNTYDICRNCYTNKSTNSINSSWCNHHNLWNIRYNRQNNIYEKN